MAGLPLLVEYLVARAGHTVVLELRLPPRPEGAYALEALPSGRVRPTALLVDLDTGDGRVTVRTPLTRPVALAPGRAPEPTTPG